MPQGAQDELFVERLLVGEVVEDQPRADPDPLGDLPGGRPVVTELTELVEPRHQDLLAALGCLGRPRPGFFIKHLLIKHVLTVAPGRAARKSSPRLGR